MISPERLKLIVAAAGLLALLGILTYAFWDHIDALLGALILYVLFKPLHTYLCRKTGSKSAALIVIVVASLCILLPLILAGLLLIFQLQSISNMIKFDDVISTLGASSPALAIANFSGKSLSELAEGFSGSAVSFLSDALVRSFSGLSFFLIDVALMYAFLYYFLIAESDGSYYRFLPFNKKIWRRFGTSFKRITIGTVISTGLIALISGILIAISFYVVGLPLPLLWGLITVIVSFIPILGAFLIWIPGAFFAFINGNILGGVVIVILGLIASNIEHVVRPIVNRRYGKVHPLITLVGVIIGLPVFGIIGLVLGPLLLSYTLLGLRSFYEYYVDSEPQMRH